METREKDRPVSIRHTNLSADSLVNVCCVHHVDLDLRGTRQLTRLTVCITNLKKGLTVVRERKTESQKREEEKLGII